MQTREEQLILWNAKIERLASKAHLRGVRANFDALMYVDELKALHAIATARLGDYREAAGSDRAQVEADLEAAWSDLEAAFANLPPPP